MTVKAARRLNDGRYHVLNVAVDEVHVVVTINVEVLVMVERVYV